MERRRRRAALDLPSLSPLQVGNRILGPFDDLPADFGPPAAGDTAGLLVVTRPADACSPLRPPGTPPGAAWIALVARSRSRGSGCR